MRRYLAFVIASALLLFAVGVMAQTSARRSRQATTTTTTTSKTTVTGPERSIEGCLVKEASDFFLIPRAGSPIALQPQPGSEDLSAQEGHRVQVRGIESSMNAAAGPGAVGTGGTASAVATTPSGNVQSQATTSGPIRSQSSSTAASSSSATTGTGDDLHRLATHQMTVIDIKSVADTCPLNWNSRISRGTRTR